MIPNSWKICKVKNIYNLSTGFTPDTSRDDYYDNDTGNVWVSIADMNDKFIDNSITKISDKYISEKHPVKVTKGSLLYSFKLSVGKTSFANIDLFTNEAIASFKANKNICLPFLYYSSSLIEENSNINIYGAKLLNQELIKNALIVNPPLKEQKLIADFLDEKITKIDESINEITKQIEMLNNYKKAIVTKTITKGLNANISLKESGNKWIGKIPYNWKVKRLRYLLDEIKVGPFGSSLSGDDIKPSGDYWIYNQRNVLDNNFETTNSYVDYAKFKELKNFTVKENDVLLTTRGTIGRVSIVPKNCEKGILHPCLIRMVFNKKLINNKIIKYIFNESNIVMDQLMYKSNSTTIEVIYSYNLKDIYIPLMPLLEQEKIIEYLDNKCNSIDKIIKNKEAQLENLNKYKKSVIYEYVTGKKRVEGAEELYG